MSITTTTRRRRTKPSCRCRRCPSSRRDSFSPNVVQSLYKRSGGRCCKCGAATFGPHKYDQDKFRSVGEAAHIAAAARGGPRYDRRMSRKERCSAANGLWLCSKCHRIVDRNTKKYTTAVLMELKRRGEERARRMIGVASTEEEEEEEEENEEEEEQLQISMLLDLALHLFLLLLLKRKRRKRKSIGLF